MHLILILSTIATFVWLYASGIFTADQLQTACLTLVAVQITMLAMVVCLFFNATHRRHRVDYDENSTSHSY